MKRVPNDRSSRGAQAEARLARAAPGAPASPSRILHELQVHQIELEMQNEELRRTQVELQLSRDRYLDLYDFAPVGYLTLSDSGRIEEANLTGAAILGLELRKLRGSRFAAVVAPESLGAWGRLLADVGRGDEQGACDLVLRRGDGSAFHGHVDCRLREGLDSGASMRVVLTDVTDLKHAEEKLRESEGRFRLLANEAAIGIFLTGPLGQVEFVNPTYLALTGLSEEEARAPDAAKAIDPGDRDRALREWRTATASGQPYSSEYRLLHGSGKVTWVRAIGRPYRDGAGAIGGYVGALVDISEPRALQAQLALASRLAAMGTLVAGVAHEINNPLAATLSFQELALLVVHDLRGRLQGSEPLDRVAEAHRLDVVAGDLGDAQAGARRVERIVKDLKTFGRPDLARTRVKLADVLAQAMRWVPATVGHDATIRVEDQGAPDVLASFGQLQQVVVNLMVNAAKASPAGRTSQILARIGPGGPGMARLEVVDQGAGIDPAILDRIFEPFFTTSDVGKGMGLGLAVSHAIVTGHGGTLTVESVLGQGSTFRVELPAAQNPSVS